jgi:CcmD family protein
MLKRFLTFVISFVLVATALACSNAPVTAAAQPPAAQGQPPTEGQSEFVPVSELPPADQLPAAPLLVAAYAFVWVAVLYYVWTIWRRLNKVEKDMQALARRSQPR